MPDTVIGPYASAADLSMIEFPLVPKFGLSSGQVSEE
jgi:hypothetical protein